MPVIVIYFTWKFFLIPICSRFIVCFPQLLLWRQIFTYFVRVLLWFLWVIQSDLFLWFCSTPPFWRYIYFATPLSLSGMCFAWKHALHLKMHVSTQPLQQTDPQSLHHVHTTGYYSYIHVHIIYQTSKWLSLLGVHIFSCSVVSGWCCTKLFEFLVFFFHW